ncbi:MAG: glutathione S-transferase family protein [Candidatus Binatia bacterium]
MDELVLHAAPDAPASRATLWALARKGLVARLVEVAPDARLVEDVGPPLLEVAGVPVAGFRAIAFRLERAHSEPSFFPADSRRRNQAGTLAEFAECVVEPLLERARADSSADLGELLSALAQVRDAIRHGALDRGEAHLGDIAVAAMLVSVAEIEALDFARDYADLAAYTERVRALCRL